MGEMLYLQANAGAVTISDGFDYDFVCGTTGTGIEIKTDFYSLDGTPNFFMERFSDLEAQTPGGPWQALEKGARDFVYFYIPSLIYYTFETQALVERLETIIPELKPFDVRNTKHITQGYRVARALIEDLAAVTKLRVVKDEGDSS